MEASNTNVVAVVHRLFQEVWNRGDLALADVIFEHAVPAVAFIRQFRTAFPDIQHTIEATLVTGAHVAVQWRATGTHQDHWEGLAPTHLPVGFTGITVATVQGGKIQSHHTEWDQAGLLAQLRQ
jgi:predicted ester cyclase